MRRKINAVLVLLIAMIVNCLSVPSVLAENNAWREFYVNQNGSDSNDGSQNMPFKTVLHAIDAAKEASSDMKGDIVINISEGIHYQEEAWEFTTENSGKNGHNIIFNGAGAEKTIISGGKPISGFEQWEGNSEIWRAPVEDVKSIRNLYINGEMRFRAKGDKMYLGQYSPASMRSSEFYSENPDAPKDNYNFYDTETWYKYDGLYMSKDDIGHWRNVKDIEFIWIVEWLPHIMHLDSIEEVPEDNKLLRIRMNPLFNFMRTQNSNNNSGRPERYFEISNAFELLDTPGEFYYDSSEKYVYYMPYEGEDMTTAQVVVPIQDRILVAMGDSTDAKVENITFQNMKFTQYTSDVLDVVGAVNNQAMGWQHANGRYSHAAVYIERAKNINFYSNHFMGIEFAGIHMMNAVEQCEVIGNAFSEIGDFAVLVGSQAHQDSVVYDNEHSTVPTRDDYYVKLIDSETEHKVSFNEQAKYHGWWCSSKGVVFWQDSGRPYNLSDRSWYIPELDNEINLTWFGDPKAKEKGENQWARFDFKRKYKVDKVVLGYRMWETRPEHRSNFEILLSNDRDFKEGSYVVAHKQTEPLQNEFNEIMLDVNEKYRYMMVRTITPSAIGISYIQALTKDVLPYVRFERNKNIKINNNYFKDIGVSTYNGAVHEWLNRGVEIVHNEIDNVGYAGISSGGLLSNTSYSHFDANVSYNRINQVNKVLADGAGIYALGRSPGMVVHDNYISNTNLAYGALYADQGSASMHWYDNVVTNASRCWHLWINTIIENVFERTYSSTVTVNNNSGKDTVFEDPRVFVNGDPPKAAYTIMKNSGLEPEYEDIKAWVKGDTKFKYAWDYYTYKGYISKRLYSEIIGDTENILKSKNVGFGLGQHTPQYITELQNAIDVYSSNKETDSTVAFLKIRDLVRDAGERFNRLEIPEMIEYIEKDLKDNPSQFDAAVLEAFKKDFDEFRKNFEDGSYKADEYTFITDMEKKYNAFNEKRKANGIGYVFAQDSNNCSIDNEKRTVTLTFPSNKDLSAVKLLIYPMPYSKLSTRINNAYNLNKPVKVTIYSENAGVYDEWVIKANTADHIERYELIPEDFVTDSEAPAAIQKCNNGTDIRLHTDMLPIYAKAYSEEKSGASVKFKPIAPAEEGGNFKFIVGASGTTDITATSKYDKSNRFEVEFTRNTVRLYSVTNGVSALVKEKEYILDFNKISTFDYKLSPVGENTQVIINVNGEQVLNEVSSLNHTGMYFGFISDKIDIRIIG